MTSIDKALKLRSIVGELRQRARDASSARARTTWRGLAKKIEERSRLNLSTAWWLSKAEAMLEEAT